MQRHTWPQILINSHSAAIVHDSAAISSLLVADNRVCCDGVTAITESPVIGLLTATVWAHAVAGGADLSLQQCGTLRQIGTLPWGVQLICDILALQIC